MTDFDDLNASDRDFATQIARALKDEATASRFDLMPSAVAAGRKARIVRRLALGAGVTALAAAVTVAGVTNARSSQHADPTRPPIGGSPSHADSTSTAQLPTSSSSSQASSNASAPGTAQPTLTLGTKTRRGEHYAGEYVAPNGQWFRPGSSTVKLTEYGSGYIGQQYNTYCSTAAGVVAFYLYDGLGPLSYTVGTSNRRTINTRGAPVPYRGGAVWPYTDTAGFRYIHPDGRESEHTVPTGWKLVGTTAQRILVTRKTNAGDDIGSLSLDGTVTPTGLSVSYNEDEGEVFTDPVSDTFAVPQADRSWVLYDAATLTVLRTGLTQVYAVSPDRSTIVIKTPPTSNAATAKVVDLKTGQTKLAITINDPAVNFTYQHSVSYLGNDRVGLDVTTGSTGGGQALFTVDLAAATAWRSTDWYTNSGTADFSYHLVLANPHR